jgi:prophage regulatory protein
LEAAERVNASLSELIELADRGRTAEARAYAVSLSRIIGAFLGPAADLLPPVRPAGKDLRPAVSRGRQTEAIAPPAPHVPDAPVVAASLVGLSERTILDMEKRGDFPHRFTISARKVGWDAEEVHAWIQARKKAAGKVAEPMAAIRRRGKA